jgi:hypothetical protein
MEFPKGVFVYGNQYYRGQCSYEVKEQEAFFQWLRIQHPDFWRRSLHPNNEVYVSKEAIKRGAMKRMKKQGLCIGAADIVILDGKKGPFICELKRMDHTKSSISDNQIEFLVSCMNAGIFTCVALGWEEAKRAFEKWLEWREK